MLSWIASIALGYVVVIPLLIVLTSIFPGQETAMRESLVFFYAIWGTCTIAVRWVIVRVAAMRSRRREQKKVSPPWLGEDRDATSAERDH